MGGARQTQETIKADVQIQLIGALSTTLISSFPTRCSKPLTREALSAKINDLRQDLPFILQLFDTAVTLEYSTDVDLYIMATLFKFGQKD